MLTRLIRTQLIIFTIASLVGIAVMAFAYLRAPVLLGIGRITVTMELPRGGGLYEFANVTYRGVQIGTVTEVALTPTGAEATLSLDTAPRVPADLVAEVHSMSAVGEQYVDLLPRNSSPPYLENGSVIRVEDSRVPQPVGPMLDNASALLRSIPKDQLTAVLDESAKGLDDAGYDLGSLLDSASELSRASSDSATQLQTIIDGSAPLLDGAAQSADATRTWTRSLAGVTDQLVANDPQYRTIVRNGPDALDEVSRLLADVKPTLPVLLANMTSLGQVAVTYNASLEQLLVLVPSFFAGLGALSHIANATGLPLGDFRVGLNDPPPCTAGFLPADQWRSPAETTTIDTPEGLYCKLPQDSPILVRGLRNLPCMGQPGKRAPTVQICDSDRPFEPLAMRQHALGPFPFDPNLIAQGIAPDRRVTDDKQIFGPVRGAPLPTGAPPPQPPAAAAPSSAQLGDQGAPPVVVATYDPSTGRYLSADGIAHTQLDLKAGSAQHGWQELVLPEGSAT
jgi:phospholipid/cholesterol/gamma-HCH transport system substrate-binding protein